ncbi:hypothetical protein OK016_25860 [Vibrio chagasii]|nr:hypothetical protein [Vibrio chagasii]
MTLYVTKKVDTTYQPQFADTTELVRYIWRSARARSNRLQRSNKSPMAIKRNGLTSPLRKRSKTQSRVLTKSSSHNNWSLSLAIPYSSLSSALPRIV